MNGASGKFSGPAMMLPVELIGGPLDGTQTAVPVQEPGFDVYLFRRNDGERNDVMAYKYTGRSVNQGTHWALDFLYYVARAVKTEGGAA